MGRKPRGEVKLTNAQKQKLYRERKNPDERKKAEKKRKAKARKTIYNDPELYEKYSHSKNETQSTGKEKLKGPQKS